MKTAPSASSPPVPGDGQQLIKKKELAARLGVSQRTIDNWRKDLDLPCLKIKHLVFFDLKRVMRHLEKHNGRNGRPPGRTGRRK